MTPKKSLVENEQNEVLNFIQTRCIEMHLMRELNPSLSFTNEVLNFIQDQMHRDASDERTETFSQLYSRKPVVVLFYHYL